jgi:uncharacterized protein YecA (UPF0149 family)
VIRDNVQMNLPHLKNSDVFRAATADEVDRRRVLASAPKPGGNDPCPCGSTLKFKRCHGR